MNDRRHRVNSALLAIVAEGFVSRLSFGLISFALPLYALRLGLSLTEIGLLASLNLGVAIVLKPAMGWVADTYGLKTTFTAAIVLRSVVSLLLIFATVPWQLFAIRALHGVSIGMRDPSVNALIADLGGKKAIASSFAWYQTAKTVAGAVGKALAGVLLTLAASQFPPVFAVAFVLSILPLIVVSRYVHEESTTTNDAIAAAVAREEAAEPSVKHHTITAPVQPRASSTLSFTILGFSISATAYMMTNLFPILATEYAGLSEAQAGMIYLIGALVALSGPVWGWLSDHVSDKLVLSVRSIANVLSSVLYLIAPTFIGFTAGRALDDAGKAAFRPAWGALMAHAASFDRKRRARTMSYMSAGEDAGEMVGPVVAGFLWSMWGIPVVLGARVVLAVVAEIYTISLTRSMNKDSKHPLRWRGIHRTSLPAPNESDQRTPRPHAGTREV